MSKRFWLLWLFFVPIALGGTFTQLVFRKIGSYTAPDEALLSFIGSVGLLL